MRPHRPSAATVIAFVALLTAITAPAWGASATTAATNTIKKITGAQIATNAISSAIGAEPLIFAVYAMQGTTTLSAAGTVRLVCTSTAGTAIDLTTLEMTAVQVGSLAVQ